jgi:hypothetical protein
MRDGESSHSFIDRRLRILPPLRHRDVRLLWTGMTVSLLGDGITTLEGPLAPISAGQEPFPTAGTSTAV